MYVIVSTNSMIESGNHGVKRTWVTKQRMQIAKRSLWYTGVDPDAIGFFSNLNLSQVIVNC
jgi:hypothetical protein